MTAALTTVFQDNFPAVAATAGGADNLSDPFIVDPVVLDPEAFELPGQGITLV